MADSNVGHRFSPTEYRPGGAGLGPVPPTESADREATYRADIHPENAETPASVARHRRDGTVGTETETPSDLESDAKEQN